MTHLERADWPVVERRRIEEGLACVRFWQAIEANKCEFWAVVDEALPAHYPVVGTQLSCDIERA